jgi:putative transposase
MLPEHKHWIWRLPEGDSDFATRWRRIKTDFSLGIAKTERRCAIRRMRGERGIWQRRYWEHAIRDEVDLQRHVDDVHFNPVKHGLVGDPREWRYSSYHRYADAWRRAESSQGMTGFAVERLPLSHAEI